MAAPSKSWQKFEITVARFFGSERMPGSGGLAKHSKSDSMHHVLFLEAKKRKTIVDFNAFRECQAALRKEAKLKKLEVKPLVMQLCDLKRYPGGEVLVFDHADLEAVCEGIIVGLGDDGKKKVTYLRGRLDYRRRQPGPSALCGLYGKTAALARLEVKVPVCAVKQPNERGWLIMVAPEYLPDLKKARLDALALAVRKQELRDELEAETENQAT